ncbi:MAG: hypothetical protein O3A25_08970 [Acidobacteria bacterium]|nr:hypothetical protein [Acidobacteriota bacterium]
MRTSSLVHPRIWTEDDSPLAPEQRSGVLREPLPQTAVCFSGGGTRSMVATIGQLRGLVALGALDQIGYLSCVSGSAWAAVPFLYARDGRERLGRVTPPDALTLEHLNRIAPGSLLEPVTTSFRGRFLALDGDPAVPPDQAWCRAVGETFLAPHGLYDADRPVPFGPALGSLRTPLDPVDSPEASCACHRPARAHPFPVVHATLNWPEGRPDGHHLLPFEYTPLYVGAPGRRDLSERSGAVRTLGGTYLEPHGVNGEPAGCPERADGRVDLVPAARPYTLADMIGASSALYTLEREPAGYPHARYRTVPAPEVGPDTMNDLFTDGGDVDTHALLGMLRRRVPTIVIFLNTLWPLDPDYDHEDWPEAGQIDPALAPLFGQPSAQWARNHVFPREAFREIVASWHRAQRRGRPLVASARIPVLSNSFWGITGGWEASVCWIYNGRAADWESRLPSPVQRILAADDAESLAARFPHYLTIGQNPGALTRLTALQAQLLAELAGWGVLESAQAVRDLLAVR